MTIIEFSPAVREWIPVIVAAIAGGYLWGLAKYTQYSSRREREREARAHQPAE